MQTHAHAHYSGYWYPVWTKSGNQGSVWQTATKYLNAETSALRFEYVCVVMVVVVVVVCVCVCVCVCLRTRACVCFMD